MYSQFCCKFVQFLWKKFNKLMNDKIEFDNIFDERNIYGSLKVH